MRRFARSTGVILVGWVFATGCYGWRPERAHPLVVVKSLEQAATGRLRVTLVGGKYVVFDSPRTSGDSVIIGTALGPDNQAVTKGKVRLSEIKNLETWGFSSGRTAIVGVVGAGVVVAGIWVFFWSCASGCEG